MSAGSSESSKMSAGSSKSSKMSKITYEWSPPRTKGRMIVFSSDPTNTKPPPVIKLMVTRIMNRISPDETKAFCSTDDIIKKLEIIETIIETHKLFPNEIPLSIPKNDEESERCRALGDSSLIAPAKTGKESNNKTAEKGIPKSLEGYNMSIAFAKNDSATLYQAYLHRLKLHEKRENFPACVHDIKLALKTNHSELNELKPELEAKLVKYEKEMETLKDDALQCKNGVRNFFKLTYPSHPKIPFIANCLELTELPNYGLGIITNSELKPGDVVSIENAYAASTHNFFQYKHCANCLKEPWTLIPCPSCTSAMFCNQKCLKIAYEKFHKYECKISNYLMEVFPEDQLNGIRIPLQTILLFNKNIDRLMDIDQDRETNRNIFNVDPSTINYDDIDEDDDVDDDRVYSTIMSEVNYYPIHGLTKNVRPEIAGLNIEQHIYIAVHTILINKLIVEIFQDVIKTDKHKRFVKLFIYRQYFVSRTYYYDIFSTECRTMSFTDPDIHNVAYASAAYPFSGFLNHSCAPNIQRIHIGSNMVIIVLRHIKKGGQLFDCYGSTCFLQKKSARLEYCRKHYDFTCECEACARDYPLPYDLPKDVVPAITKLIPLRKFYNWQDLLKLVKQYFKFLEESNSYFPYAEFKNVHTRLSEYLSRLIRIPIQDCKTKRALD